MTTAMTTMRSRTLLAALLLSACTAGPDYERPAAPVPVAFKAAEGWKVAAPADAQPRGAWWSVYRDPVLDGLMQRVDVSNQSLRGAEAAFRQARAVARAADAARVPTLGVDASAERLKRGTGTSTNSTRARTGSSAGTAQSLYDVSAGISWEIDLWGRVRRSAENARDNAQATAADVESARLSLQAELAIAYFQLRAADAQQRNLRAAAAAYERSLEIARNRYAVGVGARADVLSAETQLETTRAQAIAVGVQRAQFENAIAVLVGVAPSELAVAPAPLAGDVPMPPLELPSALLERRPDIAAAERRMAAANAGIGVAEAAFFPTITLGGSLGYTSTRLATLLDPASRLWSIGPQLSAPLFDGGLRSANVEQARAAYDRSVADYRQAVLTAFQQVEDEAAALRILAEQADVIAVALRAAREAERLTLNQYRAGTAPYSSVITAQTAALNDELIALDVQRARLVASVSLIRALGGGWEAARLPEGDRLYDPPAPQPGAATPAAAPASQRPGRWSGLGTAIRNLFK